MALKVGIFLFFVIFLTILAFIFSQGALPGDLLFPLKRFGEAIPTSTVVLSTTGKADHFINLANKRLDELEKLNSQGVSIIKILEATKYFRQDELSATVEIRKTSKLHDVSSQVKKLTELGKRADIFFDKLSVKASPKEYDQIWQLKNKSLEDINSAVNFNQFK